MEKITSLNFSFDKVLLQLVIPGLIAVFPWFLLFIDTHAHAKQYFQHNTNITIITVVFISLIVGILLENLGGRLEVEVFDKWNKAKDSNYDQTWDQFLQMKYKGDEPIGQRYLRNILFRMKFELSSCIAVFIMALGLTILNLNFPILSNNLNAICCILILPVSLSCYFFYEAYSSSKILARTRKLLVEKYFEESNV
jgi:hypothetical protein